MLIRRSHEQPVSIPAAAGGNRIATRTRTMSEERTMLSCARNEQGQHCRLARQTMAAVVRDPKCARPLGSTAPAARPFDPMKRYAFE